MMRPLALSTFVRPITPVPPATSARSALPGQARPSQP